MELYDLKNDPDCVNNLAAAPAQQARRAALEAQMMDELRQQGDPRMSGHGEVFDRYPYAGNERGLYDRYLKGEKLDTGWCIHKLLCGAYVPACLVLFV